MADAESPPGSRLRRRDRDRWCDIFAGTDACVAPALDPVEAPSHPHHVARATFFINDGSPQPAPAPRFSRTPAARPRPTSRPGADAGALTDWGFSDDEVRHLQRQGVLA